MPQPDQKRGDQTRGRESDLPGEARAADAAGRDQAPTDARQDRHGRHQPDDEAQDNRGLLDADDEDTEEDDETTGSDDDTFEDADAK